MEMLLLGIFIFLSLGLGVAGWAMSRSEKQIQARMANLDAASGATILSKNDRQKKLDDSFNQRVLFPLAQFLSERIQAIVPLSGKSWIRKKLIQAGLRKPEHFKIFIGIHSLVTCGPVLFFMLILLLKGTVPGGTAIIILSVAALIGFVFPLLWLFQEAGKRQKSIRTALPDFVDLMAICVEAGLGLDTAIAKISQIEGVQTSTYLKEELIRYTKDVGFGKPRREALLDLAERTGVDDLKAIITSIIQSYEMGTGVVQTLRVQSESLRQKRMFRAEERASKIPVQMVIPIYIFFFPSILMVILGPLILHVVEQVMKVVGQIHLGH